MRHGAPRVLPAFLGHEADAVRDRACERLRIEQLRVRDALAAANDHTGVRIELFTRNAELRARAVEELLPRESGRLPEEGRFLRDRVASERPEVEWHLVGVAEDDVHVLDRNIDLVGDDLRKRGADTLAEIDLSGERGDGPVPFQTDPLLQPFGIVAVPHQDGLATWRTAFIARP